MLFVIPTTQQNETQNEVVENNETSKVSSYITVLACGQYKKSLEEIANTVVGNKRVKRRSLQQIMQESFFNGANRFGNNFIA